SIGILLDEAEQIQPVMNDVMVVAGPKSLRVTLKPTAQLFTGTKTPPSFKSGPTEAYVPFFATIELTVIDYCRRAGKPEYDEELERLYTHLRRRPDGTDANALFSYIRAAARLYMSAFDVSQAEFEAVCRRLSKSADHFRLGSTSTNYCQVVGSTFY